ncbi:high-affinity Zn(2+) transporter zrt1 [Lunasporangiospora selenospora]|uniref:High-affinity Zn(2+) transporter zrt1 n=1 Tax=Lunasporangiospora selenospora TaxID=979761 RepID=A0A9P6KC55_9FUNG|nr:high-affinity Zn(2+) transporter zrt1 [Lunasporangiospora selenospora]
MAADECQVETNDMSQYDLGLHIACIFIILSASGLGVFLPVIASKFKSLRFSANVLMLSKQFGTGIILSTAFIHMLPAAMSNLSSPCLGPLFSENYTAFGGLFILLSSLFMHCIEFIAVEHNERRMRDSAGTLESGLVERNLGELGAKKGDAPSTSCPGHTITIAGAKSFSGSCSSVSSCDSDQESQEPKGCLSPAMKSSRSSVTKQASPKLNEALAEEMRDDVQIKHHHPIQESGHSHSHGLSLLDKSQRRISTYILEAGIMAHSVIIGVSLGVSYGSNFTGLMIALVVHQFFEGFALGARIAELDFETTYTHYIMALIFSLTTPTGVAIGIGIASSYSAKSSSALLVEGIFDSISTGILLYMGYVNLLAVEFNLNSEIRSQSKKLKTLCFLALWAGAAVMAVIGRFA